MHDYLTFSNFDQTIPVPKAELIDYFYSGKHKKVVKGINAVILQQFSVLDTARLLGI